MTDPIGKLVERLREYPPIGRSKSGQDELCHEAADLIEQLARDLDERTRERDACGPELKLLLDVLAQAKMALLVSIQVPEALPASLAKLSDKCRAHWNWQTERLAALETKQVKP